MKGKKGWIRIVEAFFSILLIAGVLLIVFNKGYLGGEDISSRVYDLQLSVLREIELNDNLREQVLNISDGLIPIEDDHSEFPKDIVSKIDDRIPDSFECRSKICEIDVICELNKYIDQDIYAQSVAIAATLEIYNPRQLKMFCWSD
jgi:hypothetical protein